ncbi:MAG TPA: Nramp family divalent metal transporter [Cyclobacteriaceae bacterium]|nr:Nramp family divalent metal transporter [Cyclobacteriaceae bacterium]
MKKPPSTLSSVILWSVISAAFIGPGTVTTSVTAGSNYGLSLLWAVTFATFGCIALQELSARITIASGLTFGESLLKKFGLRNGRILQWIVGGSVVFGCAAYEAGNILGAVAGLNLITGWSNTMLTILVTVVSGAVLWFKGKDLISNLMTALVVIMGVAFAALAFSQDFTLAALATSTITPVIPAGSEVIVLGLIGTTIVPYNIFIGAGISKGQTIPLMRVGLSISVAIGGAITAAILIAGISIENFDSFQEIAAAMSQQVGQWGAYALALGLFAAGFSSAITSPFAASLIATTVFGFKSQTNVRIVWLLVLLTGFVFGISGVKPIPVILAVQALNGLILPLITMYLIIIVNDVTIVPKGFSHGSRYNIILMVIMLAVSLIGISNIDKSLSATFELQESSHPLVVLATTLLVMVYPSYVLYLKYKD